MKFAILIYEGVEPIDVGATTGVLSMARRYEPNIEMFTVAEREGQVGLASNVKAIADYGYENCPEFDVLIVTGGPGWPEQCANAKTLQFIGESKPNNTLVSVCTGGMILAAAGVLKNLKVTTRRLSGPGETIPLELIKQYESACEPVSAALVDEEYVITGGGVTLAIDMMFYLLKKFYGQEVCSNTAKIMEYERALKVNSEALGVH